MIHRCLSEGVTGGLSGLPPSGDDDLRMNLLSDQELGFLRRDNTHTHTHDEMTDRPTDER